MLKCGSGLEKVGTSLDAQSFLGLLREDTACPKRHFKHLDFQVRWSSCLDIANNHKEVIVYIASGHGSNHNVFSVSVLLPDDFSKPKAMRASNDAHAMARGSRRIGLQHLLQRL